MKFITLTSSKVMLNLKGQLTKSEMSRKIKETYPHITRVMNKLNKEGFLKDSIKQKSGRETKLELTDKGKVLQDLLYKVKRFEE